MAKLLKLTGITTYTGKACQGVQIKKGETALFLDGVAEKVLRGSKVNKEGERIPYFTLVEGGPATYNFTGKPAQAPQNAFVARSNEAPAKTEVEGEHAIAPEDVKEEVVEDVKEEAPVKTTPARKTQRAARAK